MRPDWPVDGADDDDDDAAREHSVGESTASKGPRTRSRGRAEQSEALAEADAKRKIDAMSTSARSRVYLCRSHTVARTRRPHHWDSS